MNCCHQNTFSYELLIAALAVLISIITVGLTLWTIYVQRKHNRLSVKPIPEIDFSKLGGISVYLINKGIGPLLIKEMVTKDENGDIKDHIIDFLPKVTFPSRAKIFTDRWNFTILPNEKIDLFSMELDDKSQPHLIFKKLLSESLSKLTIEIKYTCMYDQIYPIYKKSFEWFGNEYLIL